jgi:hypothetical protein
VVPTIAALLGGRWTDVRDSGVTDVLSVQTFVLIRLIQLLNCLGIALNVAH